MTRPVVPCPVCGGEHESVNVGEGLTLLQCHRVPTGHAVVTQGLTADELEFVRLRGEAAELRRERDRLRAALEGLTTELEGEVRELGRPKGGQQVPWHGELGAGMRLPSVACWVRRTARDLRAVLDGGGQ